MSSYGCRLLLEILWSLSYFSRLYNHIAIRIMSIMVSIVAFVANGQESFQFFCPHFVARSTTQPQILLHMMQEWNERRQDTLTAASSLFIAPQIIPSRNTRHRNMCIPVCVYANVRFMKRRAEECQRVCFCMFAGIGLSPTAIKFAWCLMRPERHAVTH